MAKKYFFNYYRLKVGDIIREGDEACGLAATCPMNAIKIKWIPLPAYLIGTPRTDYMVSIRRRVKKR